MQKRFLHAVKLATVAILLANTDVLAQHSVALFLNAGYATFSGGDLKDYNEEILASMKPVKAKLLSNYPGFVIFSGKLSLFLDDSDLMLSAYMGHTSTGSRISYVDYSGFIYFDERATTTSMGAEVAVPFLQQNGFEIFGGLRYIANFNNFRFTGESRTPSDYNFFTLHLENLTHGFQPTVYFMKTLKRCTVNMEMGYEIQTSQKLHEEGDKKAILVDQTETPVKYSGSGFRLQLGLGFRFITPQD